MIETKKVAGRRALRFAGMDEILADAEALGRGDIRTIGNWSAAQIVDHVALLIGFSIDGFPARAPLALRVFGRMLKKRSLKGGLPAGFKFPANFGFLAPAEDVTWADALNLLRKEIGRARDRGRMTQPSPILGRMSHEDWIKLHCRQAELHFSFMHPVESA